MKKLPYCPLHVRRMPMDPFPDILKRHQRPLIPDFPNLCNEFLSFHIHPPLHPNDFIDNTYVIGEMGICSPKFSIHVDEPGKTKYRKKERQERFRSCRPFYFVTGCFQPVRPLWPLSPSGTALRKP